MAAPRALDVIEAGSTTAVGGLPHRNVSTAIDFARSSFDIPTIPSLPRRSPAESSIAQALVGMEGVSLGQYGTVAVDAERLDPEAVVATDLHLDSFGGFSAFLDDVGADELTGPVKWQTVGPISLGIALCRAGASPDVAFPMARGAVTHRLRALAAAVASVAPDAQQLVVLDEPFAGDVMAREFPIPPDAAIDLLSSAMAVLEPVADVGVHCCREADIATMLESGPKVLSVPATQRLVPLAGYIDRFLRNGGWIAWGAVATEGPVGITSQRAWHQLSTLWCELVQRGCDPELIRRQCLLTPECGLAAHSTTVADRICRALRDVSRSARGESAAARLVLGA